MSKIKIGVIEDEAIVRKSLTMLFETELDFEVMLVAESVEQFLDELTNQQIDILFLDIQLPGMSGLEGMRPLKTRIPNVEIIILTTFEDSDTIFKALCAGAAGYLSKQTSLVKLSEAARTVHRGGSYMSPFVARKVLQHFSPKKNDTLEGLSKRQKQVADSIVQGLSYKMIADKYLISIHTVRDHIRAIYKKLHIHSKAELISKMYKGEI